MNSGLKNKRKCAFNCKRKAIFIKKIRDKRSRAQRQRVLESNILPAKSFKIKLYEEKNC